MAVLSLGDTVGRSLRLVRLLGRGELGEVFEARRSDGTETVAVKAFNPRLLQQGADYTEYQMELEMVCASEHPHLVQVHEFLELPDGTPLMVMEFVGGQSLELRVHKGGRLSLPEVVSLLEQTGQVLELLEQHGTIHGDLKPGHLMMQQTETRAIHVKLLDAGAAGLLVGGDQGLSRRVHPFMAPEVAAARSRPGPAADVYGLGAVAYLALCGEPPFEGKGEQLAQQICTSEPRPLSDLSPSLRGVQEVLAQALSRDPGERQQASELVQQLRVALRAVPAGPSSRSVKPAPPLRQGLPSARVAAARVAAARTGPSAPQPQQTAAPDPTAPAPTLPAPTAPAPTPPAPTRPDPAPSPPGSGENELLGGMTLLDAPASRQALAPTPDQAEQQQQASFSGAEDPTLDLPVGVTVFPDEELMASLAPAATSSARSAAPAAAEAENYQERHTVLAPQLDSEADAHGRHDPAPPAAAPTQQAAPARPPTLIDPAAMDGPGGPQRQVHTTGPMPQPRPRPMGTPSGEIVTVFEGDAWKQAADCHTPAPRSPARTTPAAPDPIPPEQPAGLSPVVIALVTAAVVSALIALYMVLS